MDAIYNFVRNFEHTQYDDVSSVAIDAVKKEILDSLATAIGGSSAAGIKELVDLVKEWGGSEQSTVIAYGIKCPAPNAAQVNGTMIHALDYDDGHPDALVHTGCTAVSTCFAVAERKGGITGKRLISAISLGVDFMARLSLASRPGVSLFECGWHPTVLYGYLGAAAMSGIILGLDKKKLINALGIAYHQCAGNLQSIHDGALTKRMGPGLAAKGGITAALMAEKGISGASNILEGKAGLFKLYQGGQYDSCVLTSDLGRRFEVEHIGFKPYPSCGHTHAYIDAIFLLKSKYGVKADEVKEIKVFGGDAAYGLCVPLEVKRNPRNIVDAQFSVPWNVAVALIKDKVTLEDFTEEAINNRDILKISNIVTGYLDPNLSRHGVGPGRVTVIMKNGGEYTEEVEFCLGSVQRPMTFNDCARKFRECSAYSIKPLSENVQDRVIELVKKLEQLEDATEIIRMVR